MQKKLRQLDNTGDGQLDAQEILLGIEALEREKQRAGMLQKAVIGLSGFIVLLLILIGLVRVRMCVKVRRGGDIDYIYI